MFTANSRNAAAAVIGLIACGVTAVPASASDLQGPDVVVRYSDLNLGTRTGAEALYGRIEQAAAQVCREPDPSDLVMRAGAARCRNELVARTVAVIRSPQLAAVHEAHHSDHRPV